MSVRSSAACFVLLLLSCHAAGRAAKVFLKPDPGDKSLSDVYVMDPGSTRGTRFASIANVYAQHYHPAEYRDGYLYIIRRFGNARVAARPTASDWWQAHPRGAVVPIFGVGYAPKPAATAPNEAEPEWRYELWRYSRDGRGTKLWTAQHLDFRIADDGSLIALLALGKRGPNQLYLLDRDGRQVKVFTLKDLRATDLSFGEWSGRHLWLEDTETVEIYAFIRIDTRSMTAERFDVSKLGLTIDDYALNTAALKLAYSDYPPMFDTESEADFREAKTPVKLYTYDLRTRRRSLLAQSVARPFEPKWVDTRTLEYNHPSGKGRVRRAVR